MNEQKRGEKRSSRLVGAVTFSNGYVSEFAAKWVDGRPKFTTDDRWKFTDSVRAKAAEAAKATGLELSDLKVYVEERSVETVERIYTSRSLFEIKTGRWF
jgi:hypothetical protein